MSYERLDFRYRVLELTSNSEATIYLSFQTCTYMFQGRLPISLVKEESFENGPILLPLLCLPLKEAQRSSRNPIRVYKHIHRTRSIPIDFCMHKFHFLRKL